MHGRTPEGARRVPGACLADELYTHVLPHLPQVKQDRAKELNDYLRTKQELCDLKLAGRHDAMYEVLFRAEPAQFITRARFMIAMRKILQLETRLDGGVGDAPSALDRLV